MFPDSLPTHNEFIAKIINYVCFDGNAMFATKLISVVYSEIN